MSEEMKEQVDVEEEEEVAEDANEGKEWTEEFTVAAEELVGFVKKLVHETTVRRLVIRNEARHVNLEIPLILGVAGIALLPVYSAVALIAALVTDCTILVERSEKEPEPAVE